MEHIRATWKMLWFAAKQGRTGSGPKLRDLERVHQQLQAAPSAENVQLVREMFGIDEKARRYRAHTEEARQGRNVDEILGEMMQESWEDSCRRMGTMVRFLLVLASLLAFSTLASPFYFGRDVPVLFFMWPLAVASLMFLGAAFYLVWKIRPNMELREFTRDSLIAHQAGDAEAQQQILRDFQRKAQARVEALRT